MQVLIVRHAIAVERGTPPFESDEERPLTPKGARRMRFAARGIARLLAPPDVVYASPLVRAAETARLVVEAWRERPRVETAAVLAPGKGPDDVARWLKTLPSSGSVALVGHEPNCSQLLSYLLAGTTRMEVEFGKGGAALLEVDIDRPRVKGALAWFATPRLLRLAGERKT